jgi:hypothetical protein
MPLFTCPLVGLWIDGSWFEPAHRPEWGGRENSYPHALYSDGTDGNWGVHRSSFACNVGFSDGSARFRESQYPVFWNAKTWQMASKDD